MNSKRYPEEFNIEAVKQVVDRGHFVSSVAVTKNCFRLIDAETEHPFDIEDELGVCERLIPRNMHSIIHEHNFSRIRHTQPADCPVEKLACFAVIQIMLNLHNPQSPYKQEMFGFPCGRILCCPL